MCIDLKILDMIKLRTTDLDTVLSKENAVLSSLPHLLFNLPGDYAVRKFKTGIFAPTIKGGFKKKKKKNHKQ